MNSKDGGGISLSTKNAMELPPVFSIEVIYLLFPLLCILSILSDNLGETKET